MYGEGQAEGFRLLQKQPIFGRLLSIDPAKPTGGYDPLIAIQKALAGEIGASSYHRIYILRGLLAS